MGHHNIRFTGDAHASNGAWSPSTSRANFCEEDYALTIYVAEFINSVSNLAYVYFALRSPRWDFMSITLLTLGIGSFLFHATLRQTLEFADELSMLGLVWSMLQATLTAYQPPTISHPISATLGFFFMGFSAFYIQSAKIIYQVIIFAGGILLVTLRSQYIFHWLQRGPGFEVCKAQRRDWNVRTWEAISLCLVGYALWSIDLEFCHELRDARRRVGLPLAWMLELHGWWHLLTAVGASRFMEVAREVREEARVRMMMVSWGGKKEAIKRASSAEII